MKFSASRQEAPQAAQFRIAVNEQRRSALLLPREFLRRRRARRTGAKIPARSLDFPNRKSQNRKSKMASPGGPQPSNGETTSPCRPPPNHGKRRAVIRVSLSALVTIYLLVFLAAVFLLWIVGEWNRRRRERRALRYRLRCVICAFEFEDRTPALLPRCPRCGSLNERFKPEQI